MNPKDLLFSKDHEWVRLADGVCTLGITDFAQKELGEVVYVELPETGNTYAKGDEIGSIESVKAVAEVYTPLSGEVTETNTELEDSPEVLNEEPYEKGWLLKLSLSAPDEVEELMSAEEYEAFVKAEAD